MYGKILEGFSMKSSTAPKNGKQNIEERKALVFRQRLCIGAVIGVVALYLIVSLYFVFHFEPKSYINGINVSGMSVAGAKEKLRDVAPGYVLSVRGPEDDVVTIDSAALRLEVTDAPDAEKCLHRQNPLAWIAGLFGTKEYQIDLVASYDENVLGTWMDNLDMLDEDQRQAPEDAVLTCDDRGYYVIVPEVPGTTVRTEEARAAIREAIPRLHGDSAGQRDGSEPGHKTGRVECTARSGRPDVPDRRRGGSPYGPRDLVPAC